MNIAINIWALLLLAFLFISAVVIIVFLYKDYLKSKKYRKLLYTARKEYKKLEHKLLSESEKVEIHQEELLTQTEYLQELNVELERLSLVASKTDTAVLIADKDAKIIWVNEGFKKQLGYSLQEFVKECGADIYTVSGKREIKEQLEEAIRNKKSLSYASRVKTKNGNMLWVKTLINPIFDEFENVQQFIILETDISELKMVNDEMRKLSLVASKTSNAVLIFNKYEKLDWVNEAFLNTYGYSKQEYIDKFGETFADFCIANDCEDLIDKLIVYKKSVSFSRSFNDKNGVVRWKQSIITPVFYDTGELQNFIVVEADITRLKEVEHHIQEEKTKVNQLLLNILPEETAEELKSKGKATPRLYRKASVLFADIKDFTKLAEDLTPEGLVQDLQSYFSRFDKAVVEYYVEKIKTMGDAFLCVGGIPMRNKSHPFDTVLLALELQRIMKELAKKREESGRLAWSLRIGIHTGPIIAGVVGDLKMTYDIWGDSVNIAKRIESACNPGMVNVSEATYEYIKDYFECEHRGKVLAKHKGHIDMYFVHRLKSEFTENNDGITPNSYFKEMLAHL